MEYYAHTEDKRGIWEPVIKHLNEVAQLSKVFSSAWNAEIEGETVGLMHDLGKYSELFQKVLKREEYHVDHATPGALAALKKYKENGMAVAMAIQGHHDGLQRGNHRDFQTSVQMRTEVSKLGKKYSCRNDSQLLDRFYADGGSLIESFKSDFPEEYINKRYISAMLYVRMLFSALVDADFLATEAHFSRIGENLIFRKQGVSLNPRIALDKLFDYKNYLEKNSNANISINTLRNELFNSCISAGGNAKGLYTLTAPTGSGKTLAMLAFALKHALTHKLRRIIIVLPFLNIIEQSAKVYNDILGSLSDGDFVLEDHSLVEWPEGEQMRLLAENWDAPVVVTTTVRFFESLFSNRPSACRRLHNISKSVIMFDEAQTIPPSLVIPTLSALSEICWRYGSTVVFSTATQPAYEFFDDNVRKYSIKGWKPSEIVTDRLNLFGKSKRVEVNWKKERYTWDKLADAINKDTQSLTIVNLRRHAKELYKKVYEEANLYFGKEASNIIFHLSTDMCPTHRLDVLNKVKQRLKDDMPCYLISTQCVEAGVDIDLPVVWRALAPLEAIIQAAGRCNRNGRKKAGIVHIFLPAIEEELYPTNDYHYGAIVVKQMLEEGDIDFYDTDTIRKYYQRYFEIARLSQKEDKLQRAITAVDFPEVARYYRWIPPIATNVLVPYQPEIEVFETLCKEARKGDITREWLSKARRLSVGVILNKNSNISDYLEEVRDKRGDPTGWYILVNSKAYTINTGIDISEAKPEEFYVT